MNLSTLSFCGRISVFILMVLLTFGANNAAAKEIFVDASNLTGVEDGSITSPFRTILQATTVAVAGDVVTIRAGVYREEVLIPADKITFQAYQNEEVIINGTEIINGWIQVGTSQVYRSLMKWNTDSINGGNQVFVDQKMINLTRWPDQTSEDIVKPTDAIAESVTASGNSAIIFDNEFNEPDGRWVGAEVWINLSHNGTDGEGWTGIVTSTSQANHTITVDYRAKPVLGDKPWGLGTNTEFYLFNPAQAAVKTAGGIQTMLGAGEWWKNADTLYVRTPNGNAPGEISASENVVEAKKRLFAFRSSDAQLNRSYTVIRNFTLFAATITTDNNYKIRRAEIVEDAHDILIEGINAKYLTHFTNQTSLLALWTGQSGIILSGVSNILRNSTLQYSAGSAVNIMGFGSKLLNCSILDANYSNSNAGAVNCGYLLKDGEIAYNTISNTPMIAIHFNGLVNSNMNQKGVARIHHNVVTNFLRRGYDSGAIDQVGHDGRWLRIDHNEIYNTMPDANGNSRNGIYLDFGGGVGIDEGHYILDHNAIYNVRNSVLLNNIKDILAFNNLTLTNDLSTPAFHNGNGGTGVGDTIQNNIMTNMPNIDCCAWGSLKNAYVANNIVNAQGSVLNDLFVDAANNNYQLKSTATEAIDKGVDFSPFNDPLVGLPDLGPYEYGKPAWLAGVGTATFLPPAISPNGGIYEGTVQVSIINAALNGVIRYTLDGSDPTFSSPEYTTPLTVTDTTVVRSRCFVNSTEFSDVSTANFYIQILPDLPLRNPENPTDVLPGVNYEYYEWDVATKTVKIPDIDTWTPVRVGVASVIDALTAHRDDYIAYRFTGYLEVPVDGIYTLFTKSDDNSTLYIGDTLVVNNDRNHPATEVSGLIGLKAGKHILRVEFKDNSGAESLSVSYKGPGISKRFVTSDMLWHKEYVSRTAKVTFKPNAGNFSNTIYVKILCSTTGSQIYYTTDGSTPTQTSTLYTDSIAIDTNATFKAIAYNAGKNIPWSKESAATFIQSTAAVTISPKGGVFTEMATVTLSTATPGASIAYTLNGSKPTANSAVYTEPIKITASGLLKAMAFKVGFAESYIDSASYTIKVSPPVFLPESNTFSNSVMVNISCITPGANIYYAINETPTASSTLYTTPFEINSSCFIKAIAIKPGLTSSTTVKKGLTLVTGIEDIKSDELVVYPNPSDNGNFKIKLPPGLKNEKASLQVTNILGKVVYRETIAAPDNGILDFSEPLKSGCYFINISTTHLNKTIKLIVR